MQKTYIDALNYENSCYIVIRGNSFNTSCNTILITNCAFTTVIGSKNIKSINMENWKELEEYNNKYSVSSKGRFKNNIKNKILNLYKVNFGYYQVNIYYNSKTIRKYIHWLVAKSFIENPNNLSQINHKDGNKQNNSIENLEWCNQSYNIKHSYEIGLRKRKEKHIPKDLKKKVISIDINGVETEYISIREAARLINGNQSNISRCCLGIQKTAYNKVWKYK